MKTLEILVTYPDQPDRPGDTDWIPEGELAGVMQEIKAAGLEARVIGEVTWQRQLARMESNCE